MNGVELSARFSIATNRLQYCGPPGSETLLYRAITEGAELPRAREALGRFEALMPYLEAIGRKHDRDPFDFDVVEAYWLGNELLDAFDRRDFLELLDRLVLRGLPRSLARRLADHLPDRPLPHHAFHVSFVGVGNVTGHVPTTLANLEACRPGWGTVTTLSGDSLTVLAPSVTIEGGQVRLGPSRREVLPYDSKVLPGLAAGDTVALHWGTPTTRLAPAQLIRLRRYTELSFASASAALPGLGVFGTVPPPR